MKAALMTWKTEFGALSYERYWEVTGTLYRIAKKSFIKIVILKICTKYSTVP